MTQEQKEKIFSVFLPEFFKEEFKTDKVLILTQPLYRDGYVEQAIFFLLHNIIQKLQ